jgi:VWFA-related protein
MKSFASAVSAMVVGAALLVAGQAPRPPVFRTGVDLVDVAVVVVDDDGRAVPGLTASDFTITERGVRQSISLFDSVSIPIWRSEPGEAPSRVPADVATNEGVGDGRVFVLVLDALHVSSSNVLAVRRHARQFVEEHMGPADLAAVLSPGALPAATQDFTGDKARLLAAIDAFVGGKLKSATIEVEEERQMAAVTLVPMHGGKDPSDGERLYRARSIASVLEALAGHLARVERRRKALLLFSEGVDYNVEDVLGGVQRYASDVMHAMDRAIGALMRTNVSLYAIDPRALAAADTLDERTPYRESPNAPRADGSVARMDFSEPSLAKEYTASITSLRHLSDSTGGFAAVTSSDVGEAFDRLVRESSDYYVIGYTPTLRGKPGEFQPIRVQVNRPGVRVIARSGYVVPEATKPDATKPEARSDAPKELPTMGFDLPRQRQGASRIDEHPADSTIPNPPKGVSGELVALLSSPLPAAGLPLRVQAVPFAGEGSKAVLQLVTEVLGSSLAFVERGGRFDARLDIASFTVDARGHGENGRSTTMELRLTAEEVTRARTAGIRWLSQLDLAPGRYQVRVAARDPISGVSGLITTDVDVPAPAAGPSLSGVVFTSAPAAMMITRGQARLASALGTPPTAARGFFAGDKVVAAVEVSVPSSSVAEVRVVADIERRDGSVALHHEERVSAGGGRPRVSEARVPIDTATLPSGRYLLRIRLDGPPAAGVVERRVPFDVITP